jgi:hypothetical protein
MPLEQFPVTGKLNRACSAVFPGKNGHKCHGSAIHLQEICSIGFLTAFLIHRVEYSGALPAL